MSEPRLDVRGAVRRYGAVTALDGVDLTVPAGRVTGLVGPNGAGKSTLVRLCCGLERPDAGAVEVCGEPPFGRMEVRRRVGVAPQDVGVYPQLTARQNLRAFAEAGGLGARAARSRADELLALFGLAALAQRPAGQLSGGERRRLHAAAALVGRPAVVLLDEPTVGADPVTRGAILDVVASLARDGAAVLYATHYLLEVERLADEVAILRAGRLVAAATVAEVVARHGALETAYLALTGAPADAEAVPG